MRWWINCYRTASGETSATRSGIGCEWTSECQVLCHRSTWPGTSVDQRGESCSLISACPSTLCLLIFSEHMRGAWWWGTDVWVANQARDWGRSEERERKALPIVVLRVVENADLCHILPAWNASKSVAGRSDAIISSANLTHRRLP